MEREKYWNIAAGPFWVVGPEKVIFMVGLGAVNLKPEWLLKMEPAWLGMTLQEFSTRINGRLVSVCIAPLSVCIYIAITALSLLSLSVVNGNMVGAEHSGWGQLFLSIWYFECPKLKQGGQLGITCHLSILSPRSFSVALCQPAHFLQFPAFQHCKPVRGAHCKLVVPIANLWSQRGAHCKLVVPIANLWSQFGAHCKVMVPIAS